MKVLHVDAERGFSGGEVQVFLLMAGLRRRGHENLLVCPPGSRAEAAARERGLASVGVSMRSDLDLLAVWRLRRAFVRAAPDMVHLHTGRATWLGGLAARWAGLPAVTTRRMDRRVRRGWRTGLIYRHLVKQVVAISPAVAAGLAAAEVPPERTSTIPSVVDPEAIRARRPRDEVRAELGASASACVFLVLAQLVRRKGIDLLLEAWKRLGPGPEEALWIAGDGPERAALEAQAQALELGASVRFLGRREDGGDLLGAADVFVLPSRREGLGVAALEAQAAGLPVIASRVGGLAGAVGHEETGLLFEPEDVEALTELLRRLADEREVRERLGRAGPERVRRNHAPELMVAAYEELYASILAGEAS